MRMTETGIETAGGVREFDIVVWATGFDFGTGALARMGIQGRGGRALTEHWADGPTTFLGVRTHGFPNLFFPGAPTPRPATTRGTTATRSTSSPTCSCRPATGAATSSR